MVRNKEELPKRTPKKKEISKRKPVDAPDVYMQEQKKRTGEMPKGDGDTP